MVFNFLKADITISLRKFASVTLLTSGTLAWFFIINIYHEELLRNIDPTGTWIIEGQIIFYAFAIVSGIIGSLINKKGNHRKFLVSWIVLGIISTILPLVIQGMEAIIVYSILLGFSLGFGLPDSLTLIANCTTVEERGRVSGATILEIFAIAVPAVIVIRILGSGILAIVLLMIIARLVSFFALSLDKYDTDLVKKKPELLKSNYKEFIFYVIPWIIFTFASGLASNLIPNTEPYALVDSLGTPIRYVLIGVFGLIWGIIADRFGRKQAIIIGLVILAISFGVLGFAFSPDAALFYQIISGIAWGSFLSIYLVLPGDLSAISSREKFYALGTISPLIALFSLPLIGDIATFFAPSAFSQVLSVLLVLSIIPVMLAKETLQESKIRKRKMKEYTDKLGKILQESKEKS
ncbi:MAG: MFS transporter [Candidatus Bathyarchaeota archaeon]|nr:MFS transporter [Candidatus Bathyarchaeota archaeon]